MKKLLFLALLAASAVSALAVSIILPSGQTAEFTLPDKWTIGAVPPPPKGTPVVGKTVRYVPVGNANASVFITFLPAGDEAMGEADALKTMHETGCAKYAEGSVEGATESHDVKLAAGRGYYSSFTDKTMVDQPVQKGEYKTVTFATIYLGSSVLATVSILTDALDSAEHDAGMKLMESLRLRAKPVKG